MQNSQEILKKWLEKTVIELNLCPFAKKPYESGHLKISVDDSINFEKAFDSFIKEIESLNSHSEYRTILLGFNQLHCTFYELNDFVGHLEYTLEENNLDHYFQLVCFHPEFHFADTDKDARANLVNRSPMPLIHILLKEDVEKAVHSIQAGENISYQNEQTLEELTQEQIKEFFWYLF